MKSQFTQRITPAVANELVLAKAARKNGNTDVEYHHLENAHVLGQASTVLHVKVHWLMLRWGMRQSSFKEVFGQLFRLFGAASKTTIGLVPSGNTGGTNVSPFKAMPLSPEHAALIAQAKEK